MRSSVRLSLPLLAAALACAAGSNPALLSERWPARWIAPANVSPFDFGVYHFRKTLPLAVKPQRYVVHVSGDNRYEFYVNGKRVAAGPARGDLNNWRYETVDIAPYLEAGANTLAAVVWNFGQYAPEAQITWRTAFLLGGDTVAERAAETGPSWKAIRNEAYSPIGITSGDVRGYWAAGPGEQVDGARYPWGWETKGFDDSKWPAVETLSNAAPRDGRDGPNRWMLVPRSIPMMEEKTERIARLRSATGIQAPAGFPATSGNLTVPAHTKATLLLDQSALTTAHAELIASGGKGARIQLGYAEALFTNPKGGNDKGNRDEVEGKTFIGQHDVFLADGGAQRRFRTLWWRTWRYLQVTVETQDEALTIDDIRGIFTAYPFERKARFNGGSPELDRMLDTGWHTARLCAHETYMDCPYYEQLQYAGDTRIQALVSMYMTGDARLVRNAISQLNDSRTPEGATFSRAPSRQQQYIPPFSLWWIGMVHDYWMYQDDPAFVRQMMPGVHAVISFFEKYRKPDGTLGKLPWWNYLDWVNSWPHGEVPAGPDAAGSPIDMQLLLAYDWVASLEDAFGSKLMAGEYRRSASELRAQIRTLYWDQPRQMFADTRDHKSYSEHANVLAIVGGVVKGNEARDLINRVLADHTLTPTSIYFRHYLFTAVNRAGAGDQYLDLLGDWRKMLSLGLTTWAEKADPTRSDCHAWAASPNYEIFHTVLGIDSAAPGFARVLVRPFPGKLTNVEGAIPHPKGEVKVKLARSGGRLTADIELPAGVAGDFEWQGQKQPLKPGPNHLTAGK